MEKKPEQIHPDGWLKDLPITEAQNEGFKPEEMLKCPKCARLSPPTRLKCFYCNAELPAGENQFIKPNLRKLETWEKGFNVIYLPVETGFNDATVSGAAQLLRLEREDLQKILAPGKALPIARAETEREAEIVRQRLGEIGVESLVLSDEDLRSDAPARRLRGIEFLEDKLILIFFNANETAEIAREDLRLIVSGASVVRKVESIERRQKRKEENKILETTEMSADESLIDIYSRDDSIGYRIESKGFDFSCLGSEKQLFAKENIKILLERLRAFAPGARFDDDYLRLRGALGIIWEAEQTKDSKGWRKIGFGKPNFESVTIINNLLQFTKYSRLQWHLL